MTEPRERDPCPHRSAARRQARDRVEPERGQERGAPVRPAAQADDTDDSGATLRTILPPGFEDRRLAILALALAALALGFVLLYRKGQTAGPAAPAKGKSGP